MINSGNHSIPLHQLTRTYKVVMIHIFVYVTAWACWAIANMISKQLHWRHDERDGVSNNRRCDCLLNRSSRRTSKETSKLRVTGLFVWEWWISPHKEPVTRKMFSFDDVIMINAHSVHYNLSASQHVQATGLDARASRVKWPAQFTSHWYGILFIEW